MAQPFLELTLTEVTYIDYFTFIAYTNTREILTFIDGVSIEDGQSLTSSTQKIQFFSRQF